MVAVNVGIDSVETLEDLEDQGTKGSREAYADSRWEHGFIVDVGLYPGHEVFDVLWGCHLRGLLVLVVVLP